jgi:hypothetical protein
MYAVKSIGMIVQLASEKIHIFSAGSPAEAGTASYAALPCYRYK